jgi:thiol-disulfide isomerase/thioredoxin
MVFRIIVILFLLASGVPGFGERAFAASDVPRVTTPLKAPLPLPYDETADAQAQLAAALGRAQQNQKFVLIDFGGNWCPDCRILAGTLALGEVKPAIDRTFEIVMVDVGRLTKNLDIAARYGVDLKAVPTIVILDSTGRRVNSGNPAALSDARSMTGQSIVDTIFGWIGKTG